MPKTPRRRNRTDSSQASATGAHGHPYQRAKDDAKAPAAPSSSASTHPKMPNPAAVSPAKAAENRKEKRERHRKERASAAGGDDGPAPAPAPAPAHAPPARPSQDDRPKKSKKVKAAESVENISDIYARLTGTDAAPSHAPSATPKPSTEADAGAQSTPHALTKDKQRMRQEIRALQARVQKAEGIASQTQLEMKSKLADLGNQLREREAALVAKDKAIEDTARELAAQKDELETKTTLLSDRDRHADALLQSLSCTVCFETLNDPHVLTCGHAACKHCLLQWFRSPNAYRSAEIEDVQPDSKLTFRTKLCHLCRAPVFTRPVRMFVLQSVLEAVGLVDSSVPTNSPDHTTADRNPWKNIFPPDPVSYTIPDEDDSVDRCPQCGHEIADGECSQCEEQFSVDGSVSDYDGDSFDEMLDGSDTEVSDEEGDALLEAAAQVLDAYGAGNSAPRGGVPGVNRQWSPATMANWEASMRLANTLAERSGSESGSESQSSGGNGSTRGSQRDHDVYCECDECLGNSGDESIASVVEPAPPAPRRRGRHDSPDSVVPLDSDGEEYEASFIDDSEGEDEGEGEYESGGGDSGDGSDSEDEVDEVDEVAEVAEPDEPTIDELRARRANRYAGSDAPVAPAAPAAIPTSRRRRARVIDVSDSE
ncbi:E3 ubiquitin ligase [Vanrija albida]|uniref:E3 ubiquitin ligase n=1 Tax=Vanrija albida TaxID=181172 RepID=A0ABR3QCI5_9TREE